MKIEVNDKHVYFIYKTYLEAENAFPRFKHLRPHICSRGARLNAIVIDMENVPTQGGEQ